MPKELIALEVETDEDAAGNVLETRHCGLYVQWGNDVRTEHEQPDAPNVQISVQHSTFTDDGPDHARVKRRELFSSALTLEQVDALIRTLRRARRKVFAV